jgi:hypothetical protein
MNRLRATLFCAVLVFLSAAQMASAQCRQALALGLDVSGSVDTREYRLQLDGVAAALDAEQTRAALLAFPGQPVAIAVYEWSGFAYQRVIIDWIEIHSKRDIDTITAQLRESPRVPAPAETALGSALLFGASFMRQSPNCTVWTLDISGDGKNNAGPRPQANTTRAQMGGITVNGLVIGSDMAGAQDIRQVDVGELGQYFRAHVLNGPKAFLQVAIGFEDYENAMKRKLLREIQGIVVGGEVSDRMITAQRGD